MNDDRYARHALGPWYAVPDLTTIGRAGWTLMHTQAMTFPERRDAAATEAWKAFMRSLQHLFPCAQCRVHIGAYLRAHPFPRGAVDRTYVTQYLFDMHNAVNARLGKPLFERAQYEMRWGGSV